MKNNSNNRKSKKIINILLIIIMILLIISLIIYYYMRNQDIKLRDALLKKFTKEIAQETASSIDIDMLPPENVLAEEIIETPSEEELAKNKDSIDNYDVIGVLNIPSLNIKYPIISETTNAGLKISVTKYWGPNPNEEGNLVIIGHNYKTSYMLSKLPNISIGDTIEITDSNGETLSYEVYETNTIDPYDNECTSQKTNGNKEVTVITCINNGNNRFYAKARAN